MKILKDNSIVSLLNISDSLRHNASIILNSQDSLEQSRSALFTKMYNNIADMIESDTKLSDTQIHTALKILYYGKNTATFSQMKKILEQIGFA